MDWEKKIRSPISSGQHLASTITPTSEPHNLVSVATSHGRTSEAILSGDSELVTEVTAQDFNGALREQNVVVVVFFFVRYSAHTFQ